MTYFTINLTKKFTKHFTKACVRGVGIAATGGLLLGGPAMAEAGPADEGAEPVTNPVTSE